jgi:hypothetical protein
VVIDLISFFSSFQAIYDEKSTNFSKTKKATWLADVVSELIE